MSTLAIPLNDRSAIPWIGFGTGTALYSKDATQSVLTAIHSGFTHLDGAQMYSNEASLGDAIVQSGVSRSSLWLTTKLANVPAGKTVRDTLQESLRKLKTDYVDLFLIHNPKQHVDIKAVWKQMEEIKKEGLAKSIGVSNFTVHHLHEVLGVATIPPAVIQNEYHPYIVEASKAVFSLAKDRGIAYASYGGLTPIARFPDGPVTPVLERIAKRLSEEWGKPVNAGQVLQVWLKQQGIVIISTSNKEHRLREYLDVANIPELTEQELRDIETEGAKEHHRVFMTWLDKEPQ